MKPAPGLDISKRHVSTPQEGEVQPLSKLAAENPEQRAVHFAFTQDDRDLLETVLAGEGADQDAEDIPDS